jgi:hypothetical protein
VKAVSSRSVLGPCISCFWPTRESSCLSHCFCLKSYQVPEQPKTVCLNQPNHCAWLIPSSITPALVCIAARPSLFALKRKAS